jgi:hypothetical protein
MGPIGLMGLQRLQSTMTRSARVIFKNRMKMHTAFNVNMNELTYIFIEGKANLVLPGTNCLTQFLIFATRPKVLSTITVHFS